MYNDDEKKNFEKNLKTHAMGAISIEEEGTNEHIQFTLPAEALANLMQASTKTDRCYEARMNSV